jgi:DNA invertase Pin-like site-specific DNA recombinase
VRRARAEAGQVAAYVRVSTAGQDTGSQRDALTRAARARGHTIGRWFEERAGGGTLRRPVLAEVRGAARRGELATLYVFRIDRLTRSGVADTFRVMQELTEAGCNVVSVADGLPDTRGAWGDVVLAVLAAAAQIELGALRERISAARERVRARGGQWGRAPRITRAEWPRLLELAKTHTRRELARRLRVPVSSVNRALGRALAAERGEKQNESFDAKASADRLARRAPAAERAHSKRDDTGAHDDVRPDRKRVARGVVQKRPGVHAGRKIADRGH